MLVLSRKYGERLMIGNDVVITVVGVGNNEVRLGIDAPQQTVVLREELYRQVAATRPLAPYWPKKQRAAS